MEAAALTENWRKMAAVQFKPTSVATNQEVAPHQLHLLFPVQPLLYSLRRLVVVVVDGVNVEPKVRRDVAPLCLTEH